MSKISEEIFYKRYDGQIRGFRFSILPKDLKDDDLIVVNIDEGYYSDNNSWDPYSEVKIFRERDKTPEEIQMNSFNQILKEQYLIT